MEFYNIDKIYIEDNKVIFNNRVFKAKKYTIGNVPPQFPQEENDFWILDSEQIEQAFS